MKSVVLVASRRGRPEVGGVRDGSTQGEWDFGVRVLSVEERKTLKNGVWEFRGFLGLSSYIFFIESNGSREERGI